MVINVEATPLITVPIQHTRYIRLLSDSNPTIQHAFLMLMIELLSESDAFVSTFLRHCANPGADDS
jgi:hypothetical protein